jgi:outer membrane receptor protein involved in Fe transport
VFSYHAGADWTPVRGFRVRAQYGTAQRAPSIPELYSPPRDDTDTVVDICSGIRATTTGTIAANCRSNPGIASTIAANGVFNQATNSIQSPNMGSLDLREEKGTTFTLGAVFSPRAIPGLDLSVDYYDIRVTNAISALDNEILLRQCYSDAANFATNEFCGLVIRGSDGQILQINQLPQNLDRISTSGIDTSFAYRLPLEGVGVEGQLRFDLNWTHVLKKETQYQGINGTEVSDTRGQIGSPTDVIRARVGYSNDLWNVDWRVRYIGPMVSSNERVNAAVEAGIANPLYLNYDAYWRHDIGASIRPEFGGGKWRLSVGITNLFNKTGPNVPEGATPLDDNGYILDYGVVGRAGFASMEVKF